MGNRLGCLKFDKVVLDCLDPQALAAFYMALLGWQKGYDQDGFVIIGSADSNVDIAFQRNEDYVQPAWPEVPGAQQQMLHLDFAVTPEEHQNMVQHAIACGATMAAQQYSDHWTVMLDPAGHPFCIDAM